MSTENPQKTLDERAINFKLPASQYKLKVIDADKGESSKGTPCINLTCEIFDKPLIEGIDVNGLQIRTTTYLTEKGIEYINRLRSALDLPVVTAETLNEVNAQEYIGCEGFAKCVGTSEEDKDEITGEQLSDPYSGKPLFKTRREVKEWYPRPKKAS